MSTREMAAKPRATRPIGKRSDDTDRAVPPAPVSGAPIGNGVVVVVVVVPDEARGVPPDVPAASVVDVVGTVVVLVVVDNVVEVVDVAKRQVGTVIVLSSMVTAPPRARTRPFTAAPVFNVIDVVARIDPAKFVVVPRVAELPTCQNTLHACAPFSSATTLVDAVVKDDPASKMKTESGLPPPLRVTVPVRPMDEVERYTPETSVDPPKSPATVTYGDRPAALLEAVMRSFSAVSATPFATYVAPVVWEPGGNPESAVPGESPMSPLIVVGPVLVMALPANTAKDDAVPRLTGAVAADAVWAPKAAKVRNAIPVTKKVPKESRRLRTTAGEDE